MTFIRATMLAAATTFVLAGCAAATTPDEPALPADVHVAAPDLDTVAPAKKKEDLCSHAVGLKWRASNADEAARAQDMIDMFCN